MRTKLRRWLLPWLLAVAALANLAYPMYVHYDFSHSSDARSYLRMAAGHFDSVRVTHRYRVLVPAAAGAVAVPVTKLYARVWPQRPAGLWPLRFAFYLVNCLLMAAASACWFNAARSAGASPEAAALAILAVLTSRWAVYGAGLPLTDSLYLLVVSLGYYAIRRGPGGGWPLALALVIGPLAKESFVFLLPWLFWFGRPALPWPKQALALVVGLTSLFVVHRWVDAHIGAVADQSVSNALEHFDNITYSIRRAASPKGLGELLSVFGFFTFIPPLMFRLQKRKLHASQPSIFTRLNGNGPEIALLAAVAIHMLLSGDLGRMGYLFAPAFSALLALSFTYWQPLVKPKH
jgi:hypothetical protein